MHKQGFFAEVKAAITQSLALSARQPLKRNTSRGVP
jgi:hypothetical protein